MSHYDHAGARVALAIAIIAAAAACADQPTTPTGAQRCTIEPSAFAASANTWTRDDVAPVLDDAANRLAGNLGSGLPSLEFQTAMRSLESAWTRDDDAACHALHAARTAFTRLSADSATIADRDALQMTLDLAGAALGDTQQ